MEHVPDHAHHHPRQPHGTRGFATGAAAEAAASEVKPPSALSIARELIRTEGIRGVYRGFFATCARDVPFSAIYFPFFAHLNAMVSISTNQCQPYKSYRHCRSTCAIPPIKGTSIIWNLTQVHKSPQNRPLFTFKFQSPGNIFKRCALYHASPIYVFNPNNNLTLALCHVCVMCSSIILYSNIVSCLFSWFPHSRVLMRMVKLALDIHFYQE